MSPVSSDKSFAILFYRVNAYRAIYKDSIDREKVVIKVHFELRIFEIKFYFNF